MGKRYLVLMIDYTTYSDQEIRESLLGVYCFLEMEPSEQLREEMEGLKAEIKI